MTKSTKSHLRPLQTPLSLCSQGSQSRLEKYLISELMEFVESEQLKVNAAVALSRLHEMEQWAVVDAIDSTGRYPDVHRARLMTMLGRNGDLDEQIAKAILAADNLRHPIKIQYEDHFRVLLPIAMTKSGLQDLENFIFESLKTNFPENITLDQAELSQCLNDFLIIPQQNSLSKHVQSETER